MTQPNSPHPPHEPHATDALTGDELPHRPADDREEIYYQGSPLLRGELSKVFTWTLAGLIFIAVPIVWHLLRKNWPMPAWLIAAFIVIGIVLLLVPMVQMKTLRYRISNYRIDFERGLLSRTIDTMELWHVEDLRFHQSFMDRILGVGSIEVMSHDDTTPVLMIHSIPKARELFETLKQRVIAVKRQRGVIKMDTGG